MKKPIKSILGVTLLEVMLVLVVAAMIIVMSIRYYQSTQVAHQANTTLQQILAITAAADSISQAQGTYAGVSNTSIAGFLPSNGLTTAWNTPITVASDSATTYTVSFTGASAVVCTSVTAQLKANSHISGLGSCTGTTTDISYTYNSTPVSPPTP